MNHDPIQEMGGLNLYVAVLNNPVNRYDPHGLFGLADAIKFLKGVWAGLGISGIADLIVNHSFSFANCDGRCQSQESCLNCCKTAAAGAAAAAMTKFAAEMGLAGLAIGATGGSVGWGMGIGLIIHAHSEILSDLQSIKDQWNACDTKCDKKPTQAHLRR